MTRDLKHSSFYFFCEDKLGVGWAESEPENWWLYHFFKDVIDLWKK